MKKIHFHSDCFFFAGCEAMLINFWKSPELRSQYEISFSYRSSVKYNEGLKDRIQLDFPHYPLKFIDFSDPDYLSLISPLFLRRVIKLLIRYLFLIPLFVYQLCVFYKLLKKIAPDIVHINNGGYPAAFSSRVMAIAASMARVPIKIMVVNNFAIGYEQGLRILAFPFDRAVVHSIDTFITGSQAAGRQLKQVLDLPDRKLTSIHNGIQTRVKTETLEQTRKRLGLENFKGVVFGIVAILQENKGHKYLLEAIVNLTNKVNNLEEFIVLIEGTGPDECALKQFVKDSKIDQYCRFVGTEKNIVNFMSAIDVLILSSTGKEDFPNVILEAMGLGKAVIATLIAGTPEQVVESQSGFLVKPRDAIEISRAMEKLIKNPKLIHEMGIYGKNVFDKKFTATVSINNYLLLYKRLMK